MKRTVHSLSGAVLILLALAFQPPSLAQGPLTPPGPPAPTMKTLQQIEPRKPIHAADLPLTISQPGSYYLAENINAAPGGILIKANDVTLDLMGFTLAAGNVAGSGISVPGQQRNLVIGNGTVANWGGAGVDALNAFNSRFENLRCSGNGADGLLAGVACSVSHCQSIGNSGLGFFALAGGVFTHCVASGNTNAGIQAGGSSVVTDCAASGNGGGISAGLSATVSRCTATSNRGYGISASGATVKDCTANSNTDDGITATDGGTVSGCTALRNGGDGIQTSSDSTVSGNTCDSNGFNGDGAGIHVTGSNNRIENNHLTDNDRGLDIDSFNNFVAGNTVRGNTDNYDIVQGNQLNLLLCQIPETIDWPANVLVAGTLTGTAGADGILIRTNDVTIDLGGHSLIGVPGSFSGVNAGFRTTNITVRNGAVRGWGRSGVGVTAFESYNMVLHNLLACHNEDGLSGGIGGTVRDCVAVSNSASGIAVAGTMIGCVARRNGEDGLRAQNISDCTADSNGEDGIFASDGGTVRGCTARSNGRSGISVFDGCTVSGCAASGNGSSGIRAESGSTISDCTVLENNGDGISVRADCHVFNNMCQGNNRTSRGDSGGIFAFGNGNRIDGNHVIGNWNGISVAQIFITNIVMRNTARGNTNANFRMPAWTHYGVILTNPGAGFTSSAAWANFEF